MYREKYNTSLLRPFRIVEMTLDDLKEVLEIEQRSFPAPWSKNLFLKELHSEFSKVFIATSNLLEKQKILGYICLWFVNEEMHILNLACHPDFRRLGVATVLLEYSLSYSFQTGVKSTFLEVRASNTKAQSLYQKHGFKPIGIRREYYSDSNEDAVVMMLEMESKSFFKHYCTSRR